MEATSAEEDSEDATPQDPPKASSAESASSTSSSSSSSSSSTTGSAEPEAPTSPSSMPSMMSSQSSIGEITDKQWIDGFLAGENCVQGGTGYWKHELCFRKHARQFHKGEAWVICGGGFACLLVVTFELKKKSFNFFFHPTLHRTRWISNRHFVGRVERGKLNI